MGKYIVNKSEIDLMDGLFKQHFLNQNAQRTNKSLGDLTGITGFGFHIVEIAPGKKSTEFHVHYFEDECVYILSGTGKVLIGDDEVEIGEGDFIGYRAGGEAHTMINTGKIELKCIVVGERINHDVTDYPKVNKRLYRNKGLEWNLVDLENVSNPKVGKK